jgi:wyosine [tRNA(Phe)-imidazoG37] synthetase (radical SAM superfamily)
MDPAGTLPAHRAHPRSFETFGLVYPVISRRSRGLSIGINTNPDKVCNFDCIYCQVDRTVAPELREFDLGRAERELIAMLALVESGALRRHPRFAGVPVELLRLQDIALSGDAEPTSLARFAAVIEMVARVKPAGVKIVLITDAAGLHRPEVERGLELMDRHDGEVWAKLDAGTEEHYLLVNRTKVPFRRILRNITDAARRRPLVIQTLFLQIRGQGPGAAEVDAYAARLREIVDAGGVIRLVQLCTLARRAMTLVDGVPAWTLCRALDRSALDAIAERVRDAAGLEVQTFYGD